MRRTRMKRALALGVGATVAAAGFLSVSTGPAGAAPVTVTFPYTGNFQTFVVPDGVTEITVDAQGAQGGRGAGCGGTGGSIPTGVGGLGGRAVATLDVTPGNALTVFVGGRGFDAFSSCNVNLRGEGGFNGGADGGTSSGIPNAHSAGGGGGGASDVRVGSALSGRLVVAAGGGGAGGFGADDFPESLTPGGSGGAGGGTTGETGEKPTFGAGGGLGGTPTAGGSGGSANGEAGDEGDGGSGGSGVSAVGASAGGGGGGGLFGGGGGGEQAQSSLGGGGGGGGSSSGDSTVQGVRAGNGIVTITYEVAAPDQQPDAQIKSGGSFIGANVYNANGSGQSVTKSAARNATASYRVLVENDGSDPAAFALFGPGSSAQFSIAYKVDGVLVTSAVVSGTYSTPELAPGGQFIIVMKVKPNDSASIGSVNASLLTARDGALVDAVKARTKVVPG